ncbi:transmembrane protein, putative [Medicago truncatula]|uniref:Transmembrane protein, putative n=1 Tax=Medicago truncatula TaxID=3880 RepID=A0A072TT56_MEDTR|nr:transmembrane protein, putative [Medicago truncatula]
MKANEVAQKAFYGIRRGSFIISCNLEGITLSLATSGLSPQRSFLMAFVEVIAAGIMCIAALCLQWNWYGSIEKWHKQRKYCDYQWILKRGKFCTMCLMKLVWMLPQLSAAPKGGIATKNTENVGRNSVIVRFCGIEDWCF